MNLNPAVYGDLLTSLLPELVLTGWSLGVLLFVASYDSFRNVQASYERTYVRTHLADLTVTGGDPEALAAAVRDTAGVDRVATRTQADRPMTIGATKLVGRVIGMPPPGGPEINEIDLIAGRLPDPTRDDETVVERHTADTFSLRANDGVEVFDGSGWRTVTISGALGGEGGACSPRRVCVRLSGDCRSRSCRRYSPKW